MEVNIQNIKTEDDAIKELMHVARCMQKKLTPGFESNGNMFYLSDPSLLLMRASDDYGHFAADLAVKKGYVKR